MIRAKTQIHSHQLAGLKEQIRQALTNKPVVVHGAGGYRSAAASYLIGAN
jgi:isopentenyl phosphate kinase